ncbi:hypothetical protein NM680_10000 [Paracoccus sp. PS-1]|uniref:hypothetical protein n=1 Tax=unclassified Paracoccus (in: a-proteobacteria) TaxID=2688777 RepID=UPI0012EC07C4|nr:MULTISPECIES: hypothetical protein [unclassified Paracoccus (in: a-proteobacteria)]MDQ7262126.1 hypothetical protein [Paracoccus sp. PS1]
MNIGKKLDLVRRAVDSIRASIPSDPLADQPAKVKEAIKAYRAIAAPINRYVATMNGEALLGYINVQDGMTLDDIQAAYVNECEALNRSIVKRDRFKGLRK